MKYLYKLLINSKSHRSFKRCQIHFLDYFFIKAQQNERKYLQASVAYTYIHII